MGGGRAIHSTDDTRNDDRPLRLIAIGGLLAWALLLMVGGCGVQPGADGGGRITGPAPLLPLMAAYELEGRDRPLIFLDLGAESDADFEEVADELAAEFSVDVLPADTAFRGDLDLPALTPIDPESGQIGVSLTLGEMVPVEDRRYEATVRYARSGLDGGSIIFILEQQGPDWTVVGRFYGDRA